MKIRSALLVAALGALAVASSLVTGRGNNFEDLPVREEITHRYQLAAGARIEVSHIHGPVEIEAADGEAAEVYLVSKSANLKQFRCWRRRARLSGALARSAFRDASAAAALQSG